MKAIQTDWLKMVKTTLSLCNKQRSVWQNDSNFSTTIAEITANIKEINAQALIQEEDISSYSEQKEMHRNELIKSTQWVASRLKNYAAAEGEWTLARGLKMSSSRYTQLNSLKLYSFATTVYTVSTKKIDLLSDYGITKSVLSELDAKMNAFHAFLGAPSRAIANRASATKKIKMLIRATENIISNRLDVHAMQCQSLNNEFYTQYLLARRINNSPTYPVALIIHVTDSTTFLPLSGVDIYLTELGVHRTTNSKGTSQRKNIPEGELTLAFNYPNYKTVCIKTIINHGHTATVGVQMEKA